MAGQNQVFKLASLFSNCKIVFTNRPFVLACQPSYGLKKSTKEKIKELNIPEKPKRPYTPYIRFFEQQFPMVQKENPNTKLGEVAKKIATAWKSVDTNVKEKYEEAYKNELVSFNQKMENFNKSLTDEQKVALKEVSKEKSRLKKRRTLRKFNKETNRPKRPPTGYMLFLMDYLKKNKVSMKDALAPAGAKWKELPENEKKKYNDKHDELKKAYEQEIQVWTQKLKAQESLTNTTKKEPTGEKNTNTTVKPGKNVQLKEVSTSDQKVENAHENKKDNKSSEEKKKKGLLKRIFKF